jgi:hypothetical protein
MTGKVKLGRTRQRRLACRFDAACAASVDLLAAQLRGDPADVLKKDEAMCRAWEQYIEYKAEVEEQLRAGR